MLVGVRKLEGRNMPWSRLLARHSGQITRADKRKMASAYRVTFYILQALAGFYFTYFPFRAVLDALVDAYAYGAGAMLLLGSLLSIVGVLSQRWAGEIAGLPLCCTSLAIIGTVLLLRGSNVASDGLGLLFWAFVVILLDRHSYVRYMKRTASRERALA